MTDNAFKKTARQQQKATGEPYSRARRQVDNRRSDEQAPAALLSALGITDTRSMDPAALWSPRKRPAGPDTDSLLCVPIGLRDDGTVFWLDLKDEADGGHGPHSVMVGMTGSGKTTLLRTMVFGLLVRHSPDVVQVILGDLKGEAGWDDFATYPHIAAITDDGTAITDLVLDLLDRRSRVLRDTGIELRDKVFENLHEYNAARQTAAGKDLPPLPAMFVVIDGLALMVKDNPAAAATAELLLRKGRSLGVYAVLADQSLESTPHVLHSVSQRIALRVAHRRALHELTGFGKAAGILAGPVDKGTGFVATGPGAVPAQFKGFRVPHSLVRSVGAQLAKAVANDDLQEGAR